MTFNYWTAEEEDYLISMVNSSWNIEQMGDAFHREHLAGSPSFSTCRNESAIRRKIQRLNKKANPSTVSKPTKIPKPSPATQATSSYEEVDARWDAIKNIQERYNEDSKWSSIGIALKPPARKILTLSDIHFPFARLDYLAKALDDHADADIVVLNGDIMDGYIFSSFEKEKSVAALDEYRATFEFVVDVSRRFPKVVMTEGNHDCLDIETKCLTKEHGWLTYDQIKVGMEVLTLTPSNQTEWRPIKNVIIKDFSGELLHTEASHISMMTTPGHRVLNHYGTGHYDKTYCGDFTTAEELFSKVNHNRMYIPAAGFNNQPDSPDYIDDEIALTGWMLTDGSVQHPDGYRKYVLYQRESKVHMITSILDRLGVLYKDVRRERHTEEVCGKKIKTQEVSHELHIKPESRPVLDRLLNGTRDIPEWTNKLSTRQFEILLGTLIDGDGSRHKANGSLMLYCQGSERVAKYQALLAKNGRRSSRYEYPNDNWRINITSSPFISLDKSYKHKTTKVPYAGHVWCIQVENENFFVMRNNKTYFTGNCRSEKAISKGIIGAGQAVFQSDLLARIANGERLDRDGTLIEKVDMSNVYYPKTEKWWVQIGKTIFIHPHSRGSSKPAYTVSSWAHKFQERLPPGSFDCVVSGHTHQLSQHIQGNLLLIEQGCLCEAMSYSWQPRQIFHSSAVSGYAVIYQDEDGNTDFNASHTVYLGQLLPVDKGLILGS